jgi:inner membrane transporter RhtA
VARLPLNPETLVSLDTTHSDSRTRLAAIGALMLAMASFQAGASIAKTLIPRIGAPGTAALRVGLGALIVAIVQRPWRTMPTRRSWRSILIYGLSLGTMNLVFYMSLRTIPLGIAVALEFTGPLAVAVFSSRRVSHFVWLGLAVVGLLFLLPLNLTSSRIDPVGAGFALAAGACWAVYIVFGQKAGAALGATASAWGMLIGSCVAVPIGIVSARTKLLDLTILPFGLAMAFLSSSLPYTLEMFGLRNLSARVFGTLMSLEPAFGALAGLIFLGERLTTVQTLAIAAVMVASIGTASGSFE